eukprot:TRINITY_DN77742_c0_g1_i1.p1 TRINITY_DN77742_c0_g1~~TRINITY_DN77742_c0_g1_i1.p1  ORF type:complete len:431 (+),score=87.97 TRINITY_DN77742_c0_g1_i1:22-1293(+)
MSPACLPRTRGRPRLRLHEGIQRGALLLLVLGRAGLLGSRCCRGFLDGCRLRGTPRRGTLRRALDPLDDDYIFREEVAKLKAMRAMQAAKASQSSWSQDFERAGEVAAQVLPVAFVLWLGWVIWTTANPKYDKVPQGPMPKLGDWLDSEAPKDLMGSLGTGRAPPKREDVLAARQELSNQAEFKPETVTSVTELWELYSFATKQIVAEVPSMMLEQNYLVSLALQLAAFPSVYSDWSLYESCAVQELEVGAEGTVQQPLDSQQQPGMPRGPVRQVVLECGKMIDSYGLSLLVRSGSPDDRQIVAGATLRVKRLPEGCHVDDSLDEPSVVCTVEFDDIRKAGSLEAVAYIESIAVAPAWRGAGLASKLLSFQEDKARAWGLGLIALHVHRDNWSALRFYHKKGFEVTSDWLGWGDTFFLLLKVI